MQNPIKSNRILLLSLLMASAVLSFKLHSDADQNLYLVKVDDPAALCLDGSPAAYYISKTGDPKKIYISFQGGGWCTGADSINQTLEQCYQRTKNGQGSSNYYSETFPVHDGLLSTNEQNIFKDWTRVLIKYCDGSGHQGTRKNPIFYKGKELFFRGHNVTVGQLNTLQENNQLFSEATHVVVGGGSAGGLAVFLWTNYIKQRVINGKVWAIPDSGIFLDEINTITGQPDYKKMFRNLMKISNVQIDPPVAQCVEKFKDSKENCMFAVNLAPYIKAPMFIIQSLYDTWSIYFILGIKCIQDSSLAHCNETERKIIDQYHVNTTNAILQMTRQNPNINGYFAPVCANHVYGELSYLYSPQFRIPEKSQNSIAKGISRWMENNSDPSGYRLMDLGAWPDNRPCAGKIKAWSIFYYINLPLANN